MKCGEGDGLLADALSSGADGALSLDGLLGALPQADHSLRQVPDGLAAQLGLDGGGLGSAGFADIGPMPLALEALALHQDAAPTA